MSRKIFKKIIPIILIMLLVFGTGSAAFAVESGISADGGTSSGTESSTPAGDADSSSSTGTETQSEEILPEGQAAEPVYDSVKQYFYANGTDIKISENSDEETAVSWTGSDGKSKTQAITADTIVYAGGSSAEYESGHIEMTGGTAAGINLGGDGQRVHSAEFIMKGGNVGELQLGISGVKKLDIREGEISTIDRSEETSISEAEVYFFDNIVSEERLKGIGFADEQLKEYVSVWLYLGDDGVLQLPGKSGKWTYSQEWYYIGAVPMGETVQDYITDAKGADYGEAVCSPVPYDGAEFTGWYSDKKNKTEWDIDTHVITEEDCTEETVRLEDVGDSEFKEKTVNIYAGWNVKYKRIYGKNRYSTAYKVSEELLAQNGSKQAEAAVIASGGNYPDALSGSYIAGAADAPIFLVTKSTEDELVAKIYSDVEVGGDIYILGGTGAVSEALEKSLSANYNVKRLAGDERYETNQKILKAGDKLYAAQNQEEESEDEEAQNSSSGTDNTRPLLICTGSGFADSLSASATGNPVMLVNGSFTESQKKYLESLEDRDAYIIGGPNVVPEKIAEEYEKLTGGTVKRIYGSDRYATSVKVAEEFFDGGGTVVMACGENYPDGLTGSALAMSTSSPLILAGKHDMSSVKDYLKENGADMLYVLGGSTLISDAQVREFSALTSEETADEDTASSADEDSTASADKDTADNQNAGSSAESDKDTASSQASAARPETDDTAGIDFDVAVSSKTSRKSSKKKSGSIEEQLDALDLKNVNKLMISAHPDDETFWGGGHLLEGDYLVVCITNGDNTVRKNEFMSAMAYSGDKGIILSYPDIKNGVKSKWQECQDELYEDLKTLIEYKDWDVIVTHNPDGEYGHIHHKITDRLVTKICNEDKITDNLYYFEQYFDRGEIPLNFKTNVASATLNKKHEMAKLYKSQYGAYPEKLMQMEPYEYWTKASSWSRRDKMMIRAYTDTDYK